MKPLSLPPVASSATPLARDTAALASVAMLNRLVRWCAISVLLIGLLVLAGWALQVEALKSLLPGLASMKPNTALAFVLTGIALGLRQHSALRLGCALAVMLLGGLSLAQDLSGANFGTDELLFRDLAGAAQTAHPGRMSPITAICFMLLGGALALLGSRRTALRRAFEALALLALTLAMLALMGYAYDTAALYALPGFGSMALHTALAFALLGMGTLCARADGLAGVFASDGLGGQLARRILPLVFLTPLLLGWLILQGEQAGLFDSRQKTAVFAATMVLVLLAFLWRNALQLQSSDAKRLLAEALQCSVVEAAPNGLMLGDARGIITFVNGTMERLFGYTSQEMLGQTVEMFIPQHLRQPHLQQRGGFLADPQTRAMGAGRDLCGQRKDGSEFPLEIGLRALQTPKGPLVLASIIDISARQQAEQALREREALLRTLTDHAEVGMVMVTAEHRYAFANAAYARLLGLPSADIVGQRVADVLAPVYGSQIRPRLDRAFGGERVAYELTQPPRTPGAGERFLAVSYDPPVETHHGPCVIVTLVDVTERRRAENAVRMSEERYRSLFDGSLDAIFSLGADGRFVTANPAGLRLVGKTLEQVRDLHFLDLCAPDQRDSAAHTFRAALCRESLTLETALVAANGTRREVYISAAPAIINGEVVGLSCIGRDMTERKQAEQALRESEERLRALGDNLPNSVVYHYTHDADGSARFLYISAGTETLNGVRVPDVLRDSGTLLGQIPPEHAAQLAEAEARSARDLSDFVVEVPMQHADGRLRWMRLQSRPRRLPGGQMVWDGVQTDISQQKRREGNLAFLAELQETFALLTSSVEISRVASRRIAEHLGLRSCLLTEIDQAAGQATVLYEYRAEGASALPRVRPLTELRTAAQRQALATGKTLVSPDVLVEGRGAVELQRLAARGMRSQVSAPYLVDDGHWKFLLTALRGEPYDWPQDEIALITELAARVYVHIERARAEEALQLEVAAHQQAEDALHASNERTQMAIQATGVGIWEWNLLDDNIWWDAQMFHIYGLAPTPDGLVPYNAWSDCMLPENLPGQEALLQATIRSSGSSKREFRIRRASDAACRHIEAGETVRNNVDGKPEWVVGTNLDITERSRLEQEALAQAQALVALDRRKDEFLAMLGHELRNPLAAIANAAQLLRYQQNETPMQQHARQVIERQVGQFKHLVDDLLEVSRITSGSVLLRKEPTSIGGVVQRAVETVQPLIVQHRHALALSLPPQPLFLQADAARLEQVLVNLLTNAAKYTEDGGRIGLSVESEGDKVVIKVRDNGIGMAPELLPHIFELFTQAERSLDRSQGGLGLGLCLVQQLVELHGGTVTADSVPGQGSEFVVRLPAMPLELAPAPAPASQTSQPAGHESTGCRVLVVDDNVDAAQSLATLLEISGHQVRLAYDGPSAVQAAADYRPDVVLLDIGLPGLDGYEVAEHIRQQAALKGVVLVALTGYGQDADRQRSHDAGFDYHLTKPADFNDIKKIVASVAPVVT